MATYDLAEIWRVMTGDDKPTLDRIALGLSKIPRWLNRQPVTWSVLQHLLAADALAYGEKPEVRLAVLLHDAEEMITNDIPTPAKTEEQEWLGVEIRKLIYQHAVGIPFPGAAVLEQVGQYDQAIKLAELAVLGPVHIRARYGEPTAAAVEIVQNSLDMTPREAQYAWLTMVRGLLEHTSVRALRGRA